MCSTLRGRSSAACHGPGITLSCPKLTISPNVSDQHVHDGHNLHDYLTYAAAWHSGAAHGLNLLPIFQHLEQDFVSLITSLPEFLEPYQSVNADGATVRRYAIINPDNQAQIDTHAVAAKTSSLVFSPTASKQPKPSDSSQNATRQAATARPQSHHAATHRPPAEGTALDDATIPTGIQTALTYMQRRHGSRLTIHAPVPASQNTPHSDTTQSTTATGPTSGLCCTFALTMQPTDPAWDAKEFGSLKLQGHLSGDYPEPASYGISVDAQQNCLSDSAGSIVNQLIAAEGRQHAGSPSALQQLLRFVDNRYCHALNHCCGMHCPPFELMFWSCNLDVHCQVSDTGQS